MDEEDKNRIRYLGSVGAASPRRNQAEEVRAA